MPSPASVLLQISTPRVWTESLIVQGLRKTVQVAAFTAHLFRNNGVRGPFLVVAPLSTLQHWRREYETWLPYLNSVVYHGGAQARETIRQFEFRFDKVRIMQVRFVVD